MAGGPYVPAPSEKRDAADGNPQIKAFRRLWNCATISKYRFHQPERVSVRFLTLVSGMALAAGVCCHQKLENTGG
jgi:hypothetical protein